MGSWCQKYNNEASYFFAATEYKREDLYVHTQKNLINQVKSWEEKKKKIIMILAWEEVIFPEKKVLRTATAEFQIIMCQKWRSKNWY